ncbi:MULTISPECIES: S41 family peptidase [Sphingobacterium]|uniref:S41 family peptidase n=1 Tax=Sphingobacterium TaxID=28453 RepID=UPI0013DBEE9E|nr:MULTISPECIES: S41 family peptidase [unclassified Sphingobacterium]
MKNKASYIILLAWVIITVGCKKTPPNLKEDTEIEPPQKTTVYNSDVKENMIKDSVFYYTKLFSLWQDNMPPKNLNDLNKPDLIRTKYTQYFERGEHVLDWLVSLTPKNTETGQPIDRYSYLDRAGVVSGEVQDAISTSFGMQVFYLQTESTGNNADLYVRMVEKNSSAWEVGMRRGDRIISINGDTKIDYDAQKAQSFRSLNGYLNAYTLTVVFQQPSGTILTQTITQKPFEKNPILDYRVILNNGKRIGYLAFNSFLAIEKSENGNWIKTSMYDRFEEALKSLQGIDEFVVDLRYNGGGAVITAEYLADWFVPASKNKELMYTSTMNSYFQKEGWTRPGGEFGPVFFNKRGGIELKRIYFLVSSSTASASELLINVMKPHIPAFMIGTKAVDANDRIIDEYTYGKPVGFWEWPIVEDANNPGNDVSLYPASFKTYNKLGEGDYFNGMKPSAHVWEFSNFLDFGQEGESMLRAAITHINTGSFTAPSLRSSGFVRKNRVMDERIQQRSNTRGRMFKFNNGTSRFKE